MKHPREPFAAPHCEVRPLLLTVITSENPSVLTKQFLLEDGSLKKAGGGNLTSGTAEIRTAGDLAEFAEILKSLRSNQALCYGVPPASSIAITTKSLWSLSGQPDDCIPRSNETFSWPDGPGILMLDYDPVDDVSALSADELVEALKSAVPALRNVEMLWFPSASSLIKNSHTGEFLTSVRGQRLYIPIADATDIPRVGQIIADRLWLAGRGRVKVSRSGGLLLRTLVDTSVWQPSRLDFAAGASCLPPLVQERGVPRIIEGTVKVLDTRADLPDLAQWEKSAVQARKDEAKAAASDEAKSVRADWIAERMSQVCSDQERENMIFDLTAALDTGTLKGDFVIHVLEGNLTVPRRVSEILADPLRFHSALTLDPLEPDYDGHRAVGKLFTDQPTPVLHSFAHGGATYRLTRDVPLIEVIEGRKADAVDRTLDLLAKDPRVFVFGGRLAVLVDGKLQILNEDSCRQYLGKTIQYFKRNNGDTVWIDPPKDLVKQVLACVMNAKLKNLVALIDAPTIREDGSLITTPGYDDVTGIYYRPSPESAVCSVPLEPSASEARAALATLMAPYEFVSFVGETDRGVLLCAALTAVVRSGLSVVPAFAFDAPTKGAGKTLLATCIAILAGSENPAVYPPTDARSDDEMRKRIFAHLKAGAPVMIIDNVVGTFNSPTLASLITGAFFRDRPLCTSESLELPNRTLVIITGNNVTLAEDLVRRFLVCRIDPGVEKPYERAFFFDPKLLVQQDRLKMVQAALTLIRAQMTCKDYAGPPPLGSFETWSSTVRNTVCWVRDHLDVSFGDPVASIDRSIDNDPEREALAAVCEALHEIFGSQRFSTGDVIKKLLGASPFGSGIRPEDKLREAWEALAPNPRFTARSVSTVLGFRVDRVVGNFVLKRVRDGHLKSWMWYVEKRG